MRFKRFYADDYGWIVLGLMRKLWIRYNRIQDVSGKVTYILPNNKGMIEENALLSALQQDTSLVSVMLVNNELVQFRGWICYLLQHTNLTIRKVTNFSCFDGYRASRRIRKGNRKNKPWSGKYKRRGGCYCSPADTNCGKHE